MTLDRFSTIRAGHGIAAFSVYDATSRRYRLVVSDGGPPRTLRAGPQRAPFDASPGTDAQGRVVITYSRCNHGPSGINGRRCTLRSVNVAGGTVRTLKIQQTERATSWAPVMHRGTLVYARLRDLGPQRLSKNGTTATRSRVHRYRTEIVRRTARGRTTRLQAGPGAQSDVRSTVGQKISGSVGYPTSLAFDGHSVAYVWEREDRVGECPQNDDDRGGGSPQSSTVYLERDGRRSRIARGCDSTSAAYVTDVGLTDGTLHWLRFDTGDTPAASIHGSRNPGGQITYTAFPALDGDQRVGSAATDTNAQWLISTSPDGPPFTVSRVVR